LSVFSIEATRSVRVEQPATASVSSRLTEILLTGDRLIGPVLLPLVRRGDLVASLRAMGAAGWWWQERAAAI